jgi:enoyl-CoA hydratase/carnithine racemase
MNHGGAPPSGEPLGVTHEGAVATLWLNRPAKRNAVTLAMWQGIARLVGQLADDPSVRVLVVRGAGEHFCAGADIAELAALADPARSATYREANRSAEDALATFPKPSVAVVQGFCIGGGCEIAVACDLRIAESGTRFGITPARLGIVYPGFAVERVVKLIGAAAAKYLLYSAELVDAERALRIGLVDEVHAPGGIEERVRAFTTTLAGLSLLTQRAAKEMVAAVVDRGAVGAELARTWEREAQAGPDVAEGIRAFAEHERPRFTWTTRRERSTRTRER